MEKDQATSNAKKEKKEKKGKKPKEKEVHAKKVDEVKEETKQIFSKTKGEMTTRDSEAKLYVNTWKVGGNCIA